MMRAAVGGKHGPSAAGDGGVLGLHAGRKEAVAGGGWVCMTSQLSVCGKNERKVTLFECGAVHRHSPLGRAGSGAVEGRHLLATP